MQVMACASAYAWACLSGWPADKWSSEWRREQPCSACGKNRTAAGKANRIFFGIKREGRAPFCFPTYNTAQTVAARSLRGVLGSGWMSKATFALRKGPYIRDRDGGEADTPPPSLEINPWPLSAANHFTVPLFPSMMNLRKKCIYIRQNKQKAHMLLQIILFRPR